MRPGNPAWCIEQHNGRQLPYHRTYIICQSITPESLNMPHSFPLEHALRTEVFGTIQEGLTGNIDEYKSSSSIKIVSHRKAVELK